MNIDKICKKIAVESFLTQEESRIIVERILSLMSESLKNKEKIEIRGFGTFYTKKRKAKTVTLNKGYIMSPEHYGVLFKNSNIMLEKISERING